MNACSLRISQLQLRPAPPSPGDTREFALSCLMDDKFPEGGGGGSNALVAKRDSSCTLNVLFCTF